nr:hypothetical protein [Tanacetum cinerariifolium]
MSLTKELLTPFKDPKQEFRSSRKLFKTPGLDESRSLEYNLFSDLEENSKEEDVSNVKDPTTPKTVHSMKKVKPLKKPIISSFVHPSNKEGNIEQQLWESTKETMQILHLNRENKQGTTRKRIGSLPSFTKTNPRDHVKSILTTVEADMTLICHIGLSQYAVSAQQNSKLMFESKQMTIPFPSRLNDYYCDDKKGSYGLQCLETYSYGATRVDDSLTRKEKDLGSFTLPCYINIVCFENALANLGASGIAENVLLGIGDEKIIFKSMKPASSLIKRVYMLSLREHMELDLEARLMGETLMLNRSLDPLYEDYIKLNDLNVPLELRRDQIDDLMPTIKEDKMATEINTWEMSFLENHSAKLHVWKQEGLMG